MGAGIHAGRDLKFEGQFEKADPGEQQMDPVLSCASLQRMIDRTRAGVEIAQTARLRNRMKRTSSVSELARAGREGNLGLGRCGVVRCAIDLS